MLENQKLASLLVKFENKIDTFIKSSHISDDVAKDVKGLIKEKLSIIGFSR